MTAQQRPPDDSPLLVALAETVEIRTAQRDRLAKLLDRVDRLIPKTAMLGHSEQATLREAHAVLVECGTRKADTDRVWVDRVCICTSIADGTNAHGRLINPACALHGERL